MYENFEEEQAKESINEVWLTRDEESNEDFEFELFLSSDGKNTVRIKATTPKARTEGMKYARKVYDRLLALYGTKAEQFTKVNGIQTDKKVAPTCSVHGITKIWKEGNNKETGKPYAFWSCPTKNADGSFCRAK
jgi:hypothetical protein